MEPSSLSRSEHDNFSNKSEEQIIETLQHIKKEDCEQFENDFNNISSLLQVEIETDSSLLLTPKVEFLDDPLGIHQLEATSVEEAIKGIIGPGKYTKELKNENRKFMCEICTKLFKSKQQLRIHGVVHTNLKLYICNECEKAFKLKSQLLNHIKIHSSLKPFVCDVCGKSFRLKQQLDVHTKSHSDERPFGCYICGKNFKLKSSLQTHELVHSDIKAFHCEICGKSFKLKQQLQNHQQTHSDFKPFECDICGKTFKMKQQLQNHQKAHSDERPFKCEFCEKGFKFKQRLQVHYRVHLYSKESKSRTTSSYKHMKKESSEDHKSFQEKFLESMAFSMANAQS